MFFIRSFHSKFEEAESLSEWLNNVAAQVGNISYNLLRFIVHEAFINACKFSDNPDADIVIIISKSDILEISITDSGKGFRLGNTFGNFDMQVHGRSFKIAEQQEIDVMATVKNRHEISLYLENKKQEELRIADLSENYRGLISILRASKSLNYYYSPGSYNYLQITC